MSDLIYSEAKEICKRYGIETKRDLDYFVIADKLTALEASLAAANKREGALAQALKQSVYGLATLIQVCDGKFADGSYEQGTINSMKVNLMLSRNALIAHRQARP